MKVILLQDVKKQGKKDEIIEVSDGFAINYLIKRGLAVPETKSSIAKLNKELEKKYDKEQEVIDQCEKVRKKLENKEIIFNVKTGKEDKVFGSISSKQISEELKKQGFEIEKKHINIDESLDTIGTHNVKIELHKKVKFDIRVVLRK